MQIDKPTQGRVVQYTDGEGRSFAGVVDAFFDTGASIHVNYFDSGVLRFATSVSHSADGAKSTWRYPPRESAKIDV